MRVLRALLLGVGVAMGLWGVWLMRDFRTDQLISAGVWLAGGIVLHDGVLAPLVVGAGVVLARVTPVYARKPATIGLIVWGALTIAVANVLSGQGGKPDNDTVINRPYAVTWLVMTVLVFVAITAYSAVARKRAKAAPTSN